MADGPHRSIEIAGCVLGPMARGLRLLRYGETMMNNVARLQSENRALDSGFRELSLVEIDSITGGAVNWVKVGRVAGVAVRIGATAGVVGLVGAAAVVGAYVAVEALTN